ncbi:nucleotide exchange factor GrpE [Sphaerisporangium rufum]|uniref:nucleotide exchange factor GrpE n=1 Tax=Sphaerisporangium rufum TaxID=1381558 RepID=UPI001EF32D7E|nr:nucleotide exchange factor GrpE [Sphaerisporangium rufum]
MDRLRERIDELAGQVGAVAAAAGREHERAAHREQVIDRLHAESQTLRRGLLEEALTPVRAALYRLHDTVAREAARWSSPEPPEAGLAGPLLAAIADEVAEVLGRTGAERLAVAAGDAYDAARHRPAGTEQVAPESDGTVVRVVAEGFASGERTLRKASVIVGRAAAAGGPRSPVPSGRKDGPAPPRPASGDTGGARTTAPADRASAAAKPAGGPPEKNATTTTPPSGGPAVKARTAKAPGGGRDGKSEAAGDKPDKNAGAAGKEPDEKADAAGGKPDAVVDGPAEKAGAAGGKPDAKASGGGDAPAAAGGTPGKGRAVAERKASRAAPDVGRQDVGGRAAPAEAGGGGVGDKDEESD